MTSTPSQVVELQTNIDDVSGEIIGQAFEALMADGALDVWVVPVTMKKNRPGAILCALVEVDAVDRMTRRLLSLTGSFGVRHRTWDRVVLDREHQVVETPLGSVRLKVGRLDDQVMVAKPEFEDVRQLAKALDRPVREVMDVAKAAASAWMQQADGEAS